MTTTVALTGRTRLRAKTPLFGKTVLVLQVETHTTGVQDDYAHGHCFARDVNYFRWRDAKIEDLTPNAAVEAVFANGR